MTGRAKLWRLAAGFWFAINFFGAAYALVMGELPHAAVHVALLVVGAAVWTSFGPARDGRPTALADGRVAPVAGELADRYRNLEQSIDAVAIEVERMGEAQRYMTSLLAERESPPATGNRNPAPAKDDPDRPS